MSVEVQSVVEKIWKPNPGRQELYLSLPDSIFEQFYGGAAGGGKTEVLLMKPIVRGFIENPRFQAIYLRRTYKELEESVIERSKRGGTNSDGTEIPSFYDFGGIYNEQKKKWKFPSGATMTFGHCEEEADIRKYDTAEYQYAAFDELTSFTEFQYKFLVFSRVRSTIPSIPPLACSGSNPGNIGHRWVRERFVEPAPKGQKIIIETVLGQPIKRIFIPAFLSDNPRLMENDPLYKVRMEMLPEADRKAKSLGDWWTFSGQAFSEFRTEPFVDEPQKARHVIPPVIPDERLPRYLFLDWGYRAMTYGMWAVPLPKKCALIYDEFTTLKEKTSHSTEEEVDPQSVKVWTTTVANKCMLQAINPYIVLDPSAWQNRGVKTVAQQFIETWKEVTKQNCRIEKADNDRVGGKMLIHDYLRWKERPQLPKDILELYDKERADWILRNKGLEAYKAYLNQFAPQSSTIDEELPRLKITSNCKIIIKTLPLCIYDEKKGGEDVKEFNGDDPYDTLRYCLKKLDTVDLKNLPEIINKALTTAEDQTNYYRKMEYLEAQQKKEKKTYITLGRLSSRFRRR